MSEQAPERLPQELQQFKRLEASVTANGAHRVYGVDEEGKHTALKSDDVLAAYGYQDRATEETIAQEKAERQDAVYEEYNAAVRADEDGAKDKTFREYLNEKAKRESAKWHTQTRVHGEVDEGDTVRIDELQIRETRGEKLTDDEVKELKSLIAKEDNVTHQEKLNNQEGKANPTDDDVAYYKWLKGSSGKAEAQDNDNSLGSNESQEEQDERYRKIVNRYSKALARQLAEALDNGLNPEDNQAFNALWEEARDVVREASEYMDRTPEEGMNHFINVTKERARRIRAANAAEAANDQEPEQPSNEPGIVEAPNNEEEGGADTQPPVEVDDNDENGEGEPEQPERPRQRRAAWILGGLATVAAGATGLYFGYKWGYDPMPKSFAFNPLQHFSPEQAQAFIRMDGAIDTATAHYMDQGMTQEAARTAAQHDFNAYFN